MSGLLLFTALSRFFLRSHVPHNWDAVDYVLALSDFDLARYQPHPPGNPLYVLLGRAAHLVVPDPTQALIAISILASVVAVWVLARLGAELAGPVLGFWAAALLAVNPQVWLHGEIVLPYTVDMAAALLVVWAAWRCYQRASWPAALALAAGAAFAGGLRPTLLVLLGPVCLFGFVRLSWRQRGVATGLAAVLCLAWLVPLLWLSGGLARYVELSRIQAQNAGSQTSLLAGSITAWLDNLGFFGLALAPAVTVLPLALLVALVKARRLPGRPSARAVLLWLWLLPPVVTYLFVHVGQIGYVLVILPPIILLVLLQVDAAWPSLASLRPNAWVAATLIVSLLLVWPMASTIRDEDAAWRTIATQVAAPADDAGQTLILARVTKDGSARVAGYIFPEAHVVGIDGKSAEGWGTRYEARDGQADYRLDQRLPLCKAIDLSGVRKVVVIDRLLTERVADAEGWEHTRLANGSLMLSRVVPTREGFIDLHDWQIDLVTPARGSTQPRGDCT